MLLRKANFHWGNPTKLESFIRSKERINKAKFSTFSFHLLLLYICKKKYKVSKLSNTSKHVSFQLHTITCMGEFQRKKILEYRTIPRSNQTIRTKLPNQLLPFCFEEKVDGQMFAKRALNTAPVMLGA